MSSCTKEKNLVTFLIDGTSGKYVFDIETGIFYGIKGNPIKTCPHRSTICNLLQSKQKAEMSNLAFALHDIFYRYHQTADYIRRADYFKAADKLDAIGMPLLYLSRNEYIDLAKYIKELSAWKKTHNIEEFHYRSFREWCAYEQARKLLGSAAEQLTPEMYSEILRRRPQVTAEELHLFAYYLGRGKYWEYHCGDITNLLHYLEICQTMEKTPQKVNNFMREFYETKEVYKLRKAEYDNKRIQENYAKHSKAWQFEYGDYTIVLPTCGQDLITEGERMHHCVGGYVDRVVRNDTYIVFVRKKDSLDKCYITCQVHTDGRIGQYFLAYDRYISDTEDKDFYYAFERHLREVWEMG